jgi:DsbC/DsbD-like thiol-disulfide interchange protein
VSIRLGYNHGMRRHAVVVALTLLAAVPLVADDAPDRARASFDEAGGSVVQGDSPHLAFTAALSSDRITPGGRFTIAVDVAPRPGMHVYAPGTPYRAIRLVLKTHAALQLHEPVYPEPSLYLFKPLNEAVLVYSRPFRLTVDVTAGRTAGQRAALLAQKSLSIEGALEYQACDDRLCYLPASLPLSWTLQVAAGPVKGSAPRPGSAARTPSSAQP